MEIHIHKLAPEMYKDVSKLKGWQETKLEKGKAVEAHFHGFDAMYFTNGVKALYSNGESRNLPEYAAVFIPQGQEHAWSNVQDGKNIAIVGHFHEGHGIHNIVSAY